jgi:hypothetical protein
MHSPQLTAVAMMIAAGVLTATAVGQAQESADGFTNYGSPAQVYNSRGVAATLDGDGRRVVLTWLSDHRSTTGLLIIDAETGETKQLKIDRNASGSPFWMLMSSQEKWYTQFGRRFFEFDPKVGEITFMEDCPGNWAASFTEDDNGIVWCCCQPDSDLISFDPATRTLTAHGSINSETWVQHPLGRIVHDDAGWIYAGIGDTAAQVAAYNIATGEVRHLIAQEQRAQGRAVVTRTAEGKVYAKAPDWPWHLLYDGQATVTDDVSDDNPPKSRPILSASWQSAFRNFPDGSRIQHIYVPDKTLTIRDADGTVRQLSFDYEDAQGPSIQSIIEGPDGALYGCTGHPQRIFRFDPQSGEKISYGLREQSGHWNDLAVQRDLIFGAEYMGGQFYGYDPTRPWLDRDEENPNPRMYDVAGIYVSRPYILLAHPDGQHLIMGGVPTYGVTGGGMFIYDLESESSELIMPEDLLADHSLQSLVALPDGNLVGGTTVFGGTGSQRIATEAELLIYDFADRKLLWHEVIVPSASSIRDLIVGPDGLVYGTASDLTFFVFDATTRTVVHSEKLPQEWGMSAGHQGPRSLSLGPDGNIYGLFRHAVVRIEPGTFECTRLAQSPVTIGAGAPIVDGRIYFTSGPNIWSYDLREALGIAQ